MSLLTEWKLSEKNYYPNWLIVLRVVVGLSLFFIGFEFILNDTILEQVVSKTETLRPYSWLHLFIPWIHLLGGVLILIGVLTRWAAIIQIPILLAAIFFVSPENKILLGPAETPLTIVLIILLIIFFIKGDGSFSWKNLINLEKEIV